MNHVALPLGVIVKAPIWRAMLDNLLRGCSQGVIAGVAFFIVLWILTEKPLEELILASLTVGTGAAIGTVLAGSRRKDRVD